VLIVDLLLEQKNHGFRLKKDFKSLLTSNDSFNEEPLRTTWQQQQQDSKIILRT
jgi:hypothetical protein